MKRAIAVGLALTLALTLFGCAGQAEETPGTDGAAVETAPEVWHYAVAAESTLDKYRAGDGTVLAVTSYELPTLRMENKSGESFPGDLPDRGVTAEQLAACKAFNDGIARYRETLDSIEKLGADAQYQWDETDAQYRDYFEPYAGETQVSAVYRSGDLLCVTATEYGYWGGVHGGAGVQNWCFDLGTGEFFTLRDLSDRPGELLGAVADAVVAQIYEQEWDGEFFEDFEETIRAKGDFDVSFDEDGMTVIFSQYEIASYAAGMPGFTIGYDELAPHLNARGARLLAR